ncbi:MAG: hypothetical protein EOP50_00115 [Sphingobacteriales bacterium]|nr:MAG: hypothetical protein EOP50_00115 [Sphingobacteriales bacterium]
MRKFFRIVAIAASIALVSFGSFDIQADVQKAVIAHIKENADDPRSYENVRFGKVEKFYTIYANTDQFHGGLAIAKSFLEDAKRERAAGDDAAASRSLESAKKFMAILDSGAANYKPTLYGWKVYHKYRLKNDVGLLKLREDTFYLDKKLNVVDATKPLVELDKQKTRAIF